MSFASDILGGGYMPTTLNFPFVNSVKENWGWILFMGVLSLVLGLFALAFVGLTTVVSVIYLGVVILLNGIAHIAFGISTRRSGNLWLHLAIGVLSAIVGFIIFTRPIENALILTLFIAAYLLISGL